MQKKIFFQGCHIVPDFPVDGHVCVCASCAYMLVSESCVTNSE